MIKRPSNWDSVKEFTDRPKLPLGAYVCKAKKAAIQQNDFGDQLCIVFDIVEGEFSGFYKADFDSNTNDNKKWKGVLRIWLPKDDGSENDEYTKRTLKGAITAFEKSNPGFAWNWDEASLAGKLFGVLMRNEEWEYDGKEGWAVRPFRAISVDSVRNGDFRLPKDKPLKNKTAASACDSNGFMDASGDYDDSDVPF